MPAVVAGSALLAAGALLAVGLRRAEAASAHWFLPDVGAGRAAASREAPRAVLVLGHADPGARAGRRNRERARAAVGALREGDTLIASGGAVAGPVSEARLLAGAAVQLGWDGPILLEEDSTSTWLNIGCSAPLLEPFERILIVSEAVHAAKARCFLARQRPDLAARLEPLPPGATRVASAPWRTASALIDLWLAEHVSGWAQDPARGLPGLRRLVAACAGSPRPGGRDGRCSHAPAIETGTRIGTCRRSH